MKAALSQLTYGSIAGLLFAALIVVCMTVTA